MVTGILVILGAGVAWMMLRGQDLVAIQQLPDEAPVMEVFSDDQATDAPPTPIPLNRPEEIAAEALPLIPTLDYASLPSEARADEAPRALRELQAGHPTRIVIPTLGVDAPIRDVGLSSLSESGDIFYQWQVPHDYAVGWHHTSAPLGRPGNTVLNGHHNVYGEVFRDLENLEVGDGLIIYDNQEPHVYTVRQMEILPERGQPEEVRRENARWITTTPDERITLVTCWPYSDNSHRLVVIATPAEQP